MGILGLCPHTLSQGEVPPSLGLIFPSADWPGTSPLRASASTSYLAPQYLLPHVYNEGINTFTSKGREDRVT